MDELNFPITSINRILKDALPPGISLSKDVRQSLQRSCSLFVLYLMNHANKIVKEKKRATVTADDILSSIEDLEFHNILPPLQEFLSEWRKLQEEKRRKMKEKEKEKLLFQQQQRGEEKENEDKQNNINDTNNSNSNSTSMVDDDAPLGSGKVDGVGVLGEENGHEKDNSMDMEMEMEVDGEEEENDNDNGE